MPLHSYQEHTALTNLTPPQKNRHLVGRLRARRAPPRPANLSGRLGRRPTGRDHQSPGHADTRPNPPNEPQLPGVQVPADTRPPLEQGILFFCFYFVFFVFLYH